MQVTKVAVELGGLEPEARLAVQRCRWRAFRGAKCVLRVWAGGGHGGRGPPKPVHASHKQGVKYGTLFYGLPYVTILFVTRGRQFKSVPYSAPRLRYRFRFRDQRKAVFCLGPLLKRGGSVGPRVRDMVSKSRSSIFGNGPLEASVSLRVAMESGVRSNGFMRSCYNRSPGDFSFCSSMCLQRHVLVVHVQGVLSPLSR